MGGWKNIFIVIVVIALTVRVLSALITLENYRYANSRGMCAEYNVNDPVARVLKDECLDNTMDASNSLWLLYKAVF